MSPHASSAIPQLRESQPFVRTLRRVLRPLREVGLSAALFAVLPFASAQAIGYGSAATGGGNATPVVVTTASGLSSAVAGSTPKVVHISGTINLTSGVNVGSNTTLVGLGSTAKITGRPLLLSNATTPIDNVIIQNITFDNSGTGNDDCIRIKYQTTNVWIDHCTFIGAVDGGVDITEASDWVTVSWCKFNNLTKVSLIGAADQTTTDGGTLHVTYHHNWFGSGNLERMPSVRYGRVHVFNNYYTYGGLGNSAISGINFRVGSEVRIENNYFLDSNWPWQSSQASPLPPGFEQGKSYRAGNLTPGCNLKPGMPASTTVFTPPYAYTLDAAADVPALVVAGAGVGRAKVWQEAEDASGQSLFSPLGKVTDAAASAGQYIRSTTSSTGAAPGSGHATFTNPLGGTTAVWLRIYCPSGAEDSFWVKYGSGSFANYYNTTGTYGAWIWVKWGEVTASGTLTVAYREANTRLDRVLFTNDLGFTPASLGGSEVWVQAESASGQSLFSPLSVVGDSTASAGAYLVSTSGSYSTPPSSGHATFTNPYSGTSAVWLRIYCPSGSEDSFWVKYGGGSFATYFNSTGTYGAWIWVKWGEVTASGALTVAYREANTRLDRVLFTKELTFVPSGSGP